MMPRIQYRATIKQIAPAPSATVNARKILYLVHGLGHIWLVSALLLLCQPLLAADQNTSLLRRQVEQVHVTAVRQMLQGVCDQGAIKMHRGVGRCSTCPSYTTLAGEKSGFTVTGVITGPFSIKNQQEVLLNLEGCESDADLRGGMVLLRKADSGWSRVAYTKGFRLRDCFKYEVADSHFALVCNQSVFTMDGEIGQVLWVTLTGDQFRAEPIVRWFDNAASNPRRLVTVFPSHFQRSDFNDDGHSDLHILFRTRDEYIPDRYAGALSAIDDGYKLGPPHMLGLVYLFDGEAFRLNEESMETLQEINALVNKYLP